jgi:hypothetical protein
MMFRTKKSHTLWTKEHLPVSRGFFHVAIGSECRCKQTTWRTRITSLRPFLFIGIISATRGILLIGAKLTVGTNTDRGANFTNDMIELGVSAGVILALGITIKLLGTSVDFDEQ